MSQVTSEGGLPSTSSVAHVGAILTFVFTLFLSGCRTSPDLQPFADATSQLASSIKITGRTVVSEIDSMSAGWDKERRDKALQTAAKFDREWTQRNALANALVEYSASLTAIVQAGEQGEKSAKALAASFKTLCDAIGVALPATKTAEGVVYIGARLYGKFSRDYAAETLGEGMKKLQPSIDETAKELDDSLQHIETGFDAIRDQNAQNVEGEILDGTMVSTHRNDLKIFGGRRTTLLKMFEAAAKSRDDLANDLLKASDQAKEKEFERLGTLTAAITSELTCVDTSIKTTSDRLAPVDARKIADWNRLTAQIALVRTVRAGLSEWAAAHSRLAAAALEKKPVQVDDLVQTVLEIRDLVKTVRTAPRNKE